MKATTLHATARVLENIEIAPSVRRLRFAIEGAALPVEPGAHVTFSWQGKSGRVERSYSVVFDAGAAAADLTITVKVMADGRGGSRHMGKLTIGQSINIVEFGNAMPASFSARDYVVIAGGIGVTPMTGLVRSLCGSGKQVRMHYAVRQPDQAIYADDFRALLGNQLVMHIDSEGSQMDIGAIVQDIGPDTLLYMCGPQALMDAVKSEWVRNGHPVQNLRYETFASSGLAPNAPFEVIVAETGRRVQVRADQTLLDALTETGHEVLNDCRKGECGLCKVHVDEAEVPIDHRDVFLSPRERACNDSLCACVSRLPGGVATIRIDGIQHGRGH